MCKYQYRMYKYKNLTPVRCFFHNTRGEIVRCKYITKLLFTKYLDSFF